MIEHLKIMLLETILNLNIKNFVIITLEQLKMFLENMSNITFRTLVNMD